VLVSAACRNILHLKFLSRTGSSAKLSRVSPHKQKLIQGSVTFEREGDRAQSAAPDRTFFASDGTQVIDPDDVAPALAVPIFEVPIVLPLPETTNYFP
jgi:hypothetical protein